MIASGLCAGLLKSEPLLLPGRHMMNFGMLMGNVGAMGAFLAKDDPSLGLGMLGVTTGLSSIMGVTLTAAIGGKLVITVEFTK
jgi:NAD(P) transhydrogenase